MIHLRGVIARLAEALAKRAFLHLGGVLNNWDNAKHKFHILFSQADFKVLLP